MELNPQHHLTLKGRLVGANSKRELSSMIFAYCRKKGRFRDDLWMFVASGVESGVKRRCGALVTNVILSECVFSIGSLDVRDKKPIGDKGNNIWARHVHNWLLKLGIG